ncbi:diguanylate cyclase domain-containing protein [Desulfuromonas sp. TF]|uniref:diguanylate cyclase domain-containing protein n=1 Tax=Desulfuromonas sp. TF TaxID=1232410 RepID=UPI0012DEF714|nr:diguanylate cyclase [Desulfuromonas sp. TF]
MPIRYSLNAKMTGAVFLLVASLLLAVGFSALRFFESRFVETISRNQLTLVTSVAEQIDEQISLAQNTIVRAAAAIPPESLRDSDFAQEILDTRVEVIRTIFDNGIFLFSADGRLVAETPYLPNRRGKDYSFRNYFRDTVAGMAPIISDPYFSSQAHNHPALNFTAPIKDADGRLVGVLAGSLDLTRENILGRLRDVRIGETGYLYLYNTDRMMIMHPDPSRILRQDVPPGANVLFDHAIEGFEGSGETVNSRGLHFLATFKHLRNVNWILAANYPWSEAFAAVQRARLLFAAGMVLALGFSTLLVWLTMRRLTHPLREFIGHVRKISTGENTREPLRVRTRDEIALLAEAFNQLMVETDEQKRIVQNQLTFLQNLLDTIPNPVYYKSTEGVYLGCNRAFEQVHGRSRNEIVGRTVHDVADAAQAAAYAASDRELFHQEAGDFQIFEHTMTYADSSRRNVLFYKAVFHNASGEPAGMVGTILDITQRKAIELALNEQREFTENLLQNSAVPCFVLDRNHTVLNWTRACEELTGISITEVLGTSQHWKAFYPVKRPCLADLILDDRLEQTLDLYESYANSPLIPDGLQAEGWFPNIGGKRRYLLFEAAPIRNQKGEIIAVIETLHDLTHVKQVEEALQESEASYRTLIERLPDAILVHRGGTIVFGNHEASRLFASSTPEDLEGAEIQDLVHPDFRETFGEGITLVEDQRENKEYTEGKIMRLDGTAIDIEAASTPVFYEGRWSVQTILRDITERKELQEKIWRQANFDPLTGIPNRLLFQDRLQQNLDRAEREKYHVALLFIDLDHFKEINDTLGHDAGDELLRQTASRLCGLLRKTDTIARMGGDEFTVIMPRVVEPPHVSAVAQRILAVLDDPFQLPGGEGRISASIGIAFYPEDGTDTATLMKKADLAMYRAKESGRKAFSFYSSEIIIQDEPAPSYP